MLNITIHLLNKPFDFPLGSLRDLVSPTKTSISVSTLRFPSGDMLGTGTRMEGVTTDWGVKGYMHLGPTKSPGIFVGIPLRPGDVGV